MSKYKIKVYRSGAKYWYLNGEYHRVDGPAIIYFDIHKYWCLYGEVLTREDHAQMAKKERLRP